MAAYRAGTDQSCSVGEERRHKRVKTCQGLTALSTHRCFNPHTQLYPHLHTLALGESPTHLGKRSQELITLLIVTARHKVCTHTHTQHFPCMSSTHKQAYTGPILPQTCILELPYDARSTCPLITSVVMCVCPQAVSITNTSFPSFEQDYPPWRSASLGSTPQSGSPILFPRVKAVCVSYSPTVTCMHMQVPCVLRFWRPPPCHQGPLCLPLWAEPLNFSKSLGSSKVTALRPSKPTVMSSFMQDLFPSRTLPILEARCSWLGPPFI